MPYLYYAWPYKKEMALLTDVEAEPLDRINRSTILEAQDLMRDGKIPKNVLSVRLKTAYEAIVGYRVEACINVDSIKLSSYGAPCPDCRRPMRTPRARLCMECGYELANGQQAGPLIPDLTRAL